jgi:hypothetical protein
MQPHTVLSLENLQGTKVDTSLKYVFIDYEQKASHSTKISHSQNTIVEYTYAI